MEAVLSVIGGLVGIVGSMWLGLVWGERLRPRRRWRYWAANAVMLFAGMTITFVGLRFELFWIAVAGVGVMGGGLTGLKYGLGESVGIWKTADRLTKTDDLPKR